ncbi:MAG: adenosylcobinamide amidohydrolase [Sporomusaceae bacterium]|nr:adenosylcobinamide amidohydrolase [Sporomusaceae bacterium]
MLCLLANADRVYRYYKSIVVLFKQNRKVLSTSVLNGGYREDLQAVFNHDCNPGAGMACTLRAATYEAHLRLVAEDLGLEPEAVTGMATAASMENVSVQEAKYQELTVTAIVTGGIEVNGGRVGDPATYYDPIDRHKPYQAGTINIILHLNGNMAPGVMARALVICTEAKTAALQELMAGSNYSTGLATGSGTDSTILIADPQAAIYFEDAGKHSKLGELIGVTVKQAVKEALYKQTNLSPSFQHSILQRLKRYKVTEESLWNLYRQQNSSSLKAEFIDVLYNLEREEKILVYTSLYVHILDQQNWGLLADTASLNSKQDILTLAARNYEVTAPILSDTEQMAALTAWSELIVLLCAKKLRI